MIIFRYLTKEILITLLGATLMLLVIFVTNQSVQFLQRAATGGIPATEIMQLIALQIPLSLGYLLPLGLYLGVLLTLGRLHLESEMTVLSACGMSRASLTGMVLIIATAVACVVAWLMAEVVPHAQGSINKMLNAAAVTASVQQVIPGRFIASSKNDNAIFYANQVHHHTLLQGVFIAKKTVDQKNPTQNKWDVIVSKSAYETILPNKMHYLIFDKGYRYSGKPGNKNYRVLQFDQYGMQLRTSDVPTPNAAQFYSLPHLWSLSPTDRKAAAELQWRMAMPISAILFALLAIPLSEVQPRYGKFTQLLPAMLIYVGYADLIFLTRSWISVNRLSPTWGMWWVHGCALLLAIILMLYRVGSARILNFFGIKARS